MNICFIMPPPLDGKPPAERIFGCNYGIYNQPNLFILYSATVLENLGHRVIIKDCVVEQIDKSGFLQYIKNNIYDIYVFYTVFLSKKTDLTARNIIKDSIINKNIKFIFLATEPTSDPDPFLDDSSIVVRGEPEETLSELVCHLENEKNLEKIPGISYLQKGKPIHNPPREVIKDLDRLPFPNRKLLKEKHFYNNPKLSQTPFTTILTSRGCSYKCYYCVPNSLAFARQIEYQKQNSNKKPPVSLRSAENVIKELEMLKNEGYKAISILDDQFVWNSKRAIEICKGISHLNLEWSCLARADHLTNEEVISAMAEAGCKYIDIGIESFDQNILNYIQKDLEVNTVYKAVDLLKKYKIEPELNILLGSCHLETKQTIAKTLKEVKKLNIDYVLFSICTPFPHTTFNKVAKEKGWMIKPTYEAIDPIKESFISYPHLTKADLDSIIKKAYLTFYFRPSYLLKRLILIKSFKDLKNKISAAWSILR